MRIYKRKINSDANLPDSPELQQGERTHAEACEFVDSYKFAGSHRPRGFTLIETIVALAIFSASIVGLVAVTASGVANTNFAKNKLTASYLAQEGIELVRNMRDTTFIDGGWASFESAVINLCANGCYIDPVNKTLTAISCGESDICKELSYNKNTSLQNNGKGFFNYQKGTLSGFTRKITVEDPDVIDEIDEVQVTSTVSWQQGGKTKSVEMSETLFNWISL